MENKDINIKPSFFDDSSPVDYQIWKKGPPPKMTTEVRLIEGILFKSSTSGFNKPRYYVLFEDRLAYFKTAREKTEQAHCVIQNMRLEQFFSENEKDAKFGIRLIHNRQYIELYARSKDIQENWILELKKFCVLTSYVSSFVNIKAIGKGSFARVYLAKRKSDNLEVAVKTFDKNLLLSVEKAKPSLINEINILRRLDHDNIIKLYEVYESENHVYLVLELLNGGELFERIVQKGQYNEQDSCTLLKNLLSALAYMHSKGIMHRDIKPENLILKDNENDWDIKIADFGLSTAINNGELLFKRCGTPGYVAPEILEDLRYDERVDVFSAGVILYILLTGGSPFYGKSYNEILWKNKNCEVNYNFKDYGQKVSESAVDLLKKMLTKDPKARISASEALKHPWILSGGVSFSPRTMTPIYLSSAQENMRRFQEEYFHNVISSNTNRNRFDVKNIKPKDLDKSSLEHSSHAPSPLINGRVITVADSKNSFMSPDVRKAANKANTRKFVGTPSPQGVASVNSTKESTGDRSPLLDEINFVNMNLRGYNPDQTLLSQFTENSTSNKSSLNNTPVISKKTNPKKALNIQENLIKYLLPSNQKQTKESTGYGKEN